MNVGCGKGEIEDVGIDNSALTTSLAVTDYIYLSELQGHTEFEDTFELVSVNVDAKVLTLGVDVKLSINKSTDFIAEIVWTISADYFVSEALSLGVGFVKGSDIDAISVNARYNF